MPDLYLPGAELHVLDNDPPVHNGGARAIWHITWDKNATASAPAAQVPIDDLISYFTGSGKGSAPHLLWDPFTGRIAQMFAATSRSKSVVNLPGGVETNREGDICIQIETVFFPYCRVGGKVYATVADTPCIGLDRVMAWLRSWGVPDVWPMGAPTWSARRDPAIWASRSGHYGHSQVPENDHTDPGPMPNLFAATTHQEDDMPLTDADVQKLLNAKLGPQYAVGDFVPTLADALNGGAYATQKAEQALLEVQALAEQVAKIATTLQQGGGLTAAQAEQAAAAGARAALDQLATALKTTTT